MGLGAQLDIRRVLMGVLAGPSLQAAPTHVVGTAFAIGGQYFVTAAHVAREAERSPSCHLGFPPEAAGLGPAEYRQAPITAIEYHDSHDLAIVACPGSPWIALPWLLEEVALLTDVIVGGFPYSLDVEAKEIRLRVFRGSLSSSYRLREVPAHPHGYELSIPAPRGLSGAPVLLQHLPPVVLGVVVQNGKSGMLVHSDTELDDTGAVRTIVERYEYLTFGRAVSCGALAEIESTLLGGRLADHLMQHDLVAHVASGDAG